MAQVPRSQWLLDSVNWFLLKMCAKRIDFFSQKIQWICIFFWWEYVPRRRIVTVVIPSSQSQLFQESDQVPKIILEYSSEFFSEESKLSRMSE